MKRKVFILAIILILGLGSLISYGVSIKEPNIILDEGEYPAKYRESWLRERFNFRRERIKEALERNLISEEEAKAWEDHLDYMEEFHEERGYMPFGCGGFGRGRGFMRGYGYRRGR